MISKKKLIKNRGERFERTTDDRHLLAFDIRISDRNKWLGFVYQAPVTRRPLKRREAERGSDCLSPKTNLVRLVVSHARTETAVQSKGLLSRKLTNILLGRKDPASISKRTRSKLSFKTYFPGLHRNRASNAKSCAKSHSRPVPDKYKLD